MKIGITILLVICFCNVASAQYGSAIEDNSFFIEEAYNQEPGIVQHISNGIAQNPGSDMAYMFTQEWPVFSLEHQLSYAIPYSFMNNYSIKGIGDIMINYRYQYSYKDAWALVAPRISVILPTGDASKGFGMDAFGIQYNLPVSKRLNEYWVAHFNVGGTVYYGVKSTPSQKINLSSYFVGGSIIWLMRQDFNVVLEVLDNQLAEVNTFGKVEYLNEFIINPGLRASFDVGGINIVPGITVPISMMNGKTDVCSFYYVSFEHNF